MRWRKHYHRLISEIIVFALLALLIAGAAVLQAKRNHPEAKAPALGATFSIPYAESLGLDWRASYLSILDELKLKHLRLPLYWSEIEVAERSYDWSEVDWMLDEAQARQVQVTLVIGRKVPRWPECYIPDWVEKLSSSYRTQATLDFVEASVRRYDSYQSIVRYQVENEPFYNFGECPVPDANLFDAELALVRELSDKPIQLTVSGENEFWIDTAIPADVLGVSMYRVTWSPVFGYSVYPVSPDYYGAKALAVRSFVDSVVVSELQAEPWFQGPIEEQSVADLARQFTAQELKDNLRYARQAGFNEIYFWGVEYWYWLAQKGEAELWTTAQALIAESL